jgi:hypothetical protein
MSTQPNNQAGKGHHRRAYDPKKWNHGYENIRWPSRSEQVGKLDLASGTRCIGEGCHEHVNTEASHLNDLREKFL